METKMMYPLIALAIIMTALCLLFGGAILLAG
jgi:hypothetical protein